MFPVLVIGPRPAEGDDWRVALGGSHGGAVDEVSWQHFHDSRADDDAVSVVIAIAAERDPRSEAYFRRLATRRMHCPVLAVLPGDPSPALLAAAASADDFILGPVRVDELRSRLDRLLGTAGREIAAVKRKLTEELWLRNFITADPHLLHVLDDLRRMARANTAVLIAGETGTGKELCARACHHLGPNANGPFIPVDCPALPDHLIENELFGHARGAYTDAHTEQKGLVALARGGTLFLDEVDSLSAASQAKLLRFLQDRVYRPLGSDRFVSADVTLIAASNRDLRECVEARQFRSDLFYRLNVLSITLPPLRERPGDIELLARHYLRELSPPGRAPVLQPGVLEILQSYRWPGNVRELINTIQRAAVLANGGPILPSHLSIVEQPRAARPQESGSFREARARALEAFERRYVTDLLERHDGNVTRAARAAGKERRALGKMIRKYRITRSLL